MITIDRSSHYEFYQIIHLYTYSWNKPTNKENTLIGKENRKVEEGEAK